ncbi:MAG TPA: SRPBCC family protein [Kofleriaceae bacterium]|jgi:uncharacterized protein YndB with AHSA1/START domain
MKTVSTVVRRPLEECWRAFTDTSQLTAWVPGLRAAWLIEPGAEGMPLAVQFEFGPDLIYTLDYTYDRDEHVVRWTPREGEQGAVRGYARFAPVDGGTEITYALEHEPGRKAIERAIDDPKILVDAFALLMHDR